MGVLGRYTRPATIGASLVAAGALAVAWTSCSPEANGTGPTISAPFRSVDATSRAVLLAYARSLDFVTVDGAADTRPLSPLCAGCLSGPVLTVQPERGAYLLSRASLAEGRILARLIDQDRSPAPAFGLEPGDTSCWWVDKVGGSWRSVLISTREATPLVMAGMVFKEHSDMQWRQALARIIPLTDSEMGPGAALASGPDSAQSRQHVTTKDKIWTACDSLGCCNVFLK